MTVDAPPRPAVAPPPGPPATDHHAPRPPLPGPVMITMASVAALSAVALFLVAYAVGLSGLQEQRSQHQLYASFRGLLDPSSPIAPSIGGVIPPGSPIALVNAPAGGIHNAVVVEGTSAADLMKGPGHLRDSPLPGQAGQSIVMGRSLTGGAPFRHITSLHPGDPITVTTGQATFDFTVLGQRTGGSPLPALPASGALLTFATSQGSGLFGSLAPGHVTYVDAALQGKSVAAPAGRPVAVPNAELPGRSDPGAWPFLVLWIQGLLLAGIGSVCAWSRWGIWQTWLVGAPIILAVLWGISSEAMRLLPNLM